MDKNQITGIAIISAIFLVYFIWFMPDKDETNANTAVKTEQTDSSSTAAASNTSDTAATTTTTGLQDTTLATGISDSLQQLILQDKYGIFANVITTEKAVLQQIQTTNFDLQFSSKGGRLARAELLNYKRYDSTDLILFNEQSLKSGLTFETSNNKSINLNDVDFAVSNVTQSKDSAQVSFTAELMPGKQIVRTYSISNKSYQVNQSIKFIGLNPGIDPSSIQWNYSQDMIRLEKAVDQSNMRRCLINYNTTEGGFNDMGAASPDLEEDSISGVNWIAFKQSFFTVGIIPKSPIPSVNLKGKVNASNKEIIKNVGFTAALPFNTFTSENGFQLAHYIGPNDFDILDEVAPDFERNVDFGWPVLKEVNRYAVYPLFKFLESFISNYGLIIFILVVIIKTGLLPLTYRSQVGMAKMRVLKPEIDALNKKHENDKQKAQVETMALYKQFGVNPMSGCIPMLLQMPVLFAMFRLFPNLLELRQKPFLWATDLSSFDDIISWTGGDFFPLNYLDGHLSLFTLLMTAATIVNTVFSSQMTNQTQPGMKTMGYMMPLIFFFVLNSYASGLTYYYLLSTLYTIGQTILIRRFVDEDKIREKLDANRIKNSNGNKSSFQNSLSHAIKKQQGKKGNKKNN